MDIYASLSFSCVKLLCHKRRRRKGQLNKLTIHKNCDEAFIEMKMERNSTNMMVSHHMFPLFIILGHHISKHIKVKDNLRIPNLFGIFLITSYYCEVLMNWDISLGMINLLAISCYSNCMYLLLYFSLRENME